jgi:hypothetical protein
MKKNETILTERAQVAGAAGCYGACPLVVCSAAPWISVAGANRQGPRVKVTAQQDGLRNWKGPRNTLQVQGSCAKKKVYVPFYTIRVCSDT